MEESGMNRFGFWKIPLVSQAEQMGEGHQRGYWDSSQEAYV